MPAAALLLLLITSCNKEVPPVQATTHPHAKDSVQTDNLGFHIIEEWLQTPTPTTTLRKYAFGFSIGSKGYMGGGEGYIPRAIGVTPMTLNDFWEYDPTGATWTQKANIPFPLERSATFVIGTQGYVGTGYSYNGITTTWYNGLYQYDQASNTWTQKHELPTLGRLDATGLSIGNAGYIGTGFDYTNTMYNDWWQYDPTSDNWTQKASLPGTWGRSGASSFSIGQYGFVTCGTVIGPAARNDLWMYNPAANNWTQETSLPATARLHASGFNYGSYGALICGQDINGNYLNDFWYYDMNANTWHSDLSMGGGARSKAVGFAINGTPYVGTGETSPNNYTNDFWYLTYVFF
jgi:hypothetical protein